MRCGPRRPSTSRSRTRPVPRSALRRRSHLRALHLLHEGVADRPVQAPRLEVLDCWDTYGDQFVDVEARRPTPGVRSSGRPERTAGGGRHSPCGSNNSSRVGETCSRRWAARRRRLGRRRQGGRLLQPARDLRRGPRRRGRQPAQAGPLPSRDGASDRRPASASGLAPGLVARDEPGLRRRDLGPTLLGLGLDAPVVPVSCADHRKEREVNPTIDSPPSRPDAPTHRPARRPACRLCDRRFATSSPISAPRRPAESFSVPRTRTPRAEASIR